MPLSPLPRIPLDYLPSVIHAVAPDVDATAWAKRLVAPMRKAGILTQRQIAMFVGQCGEESRFSVFEENLWYVSPARMCEVWPSRFQDEDGDVDQSLATPFIGHPEALANHVYSGKLGNGDPASGDGWRFRGRGLFQLTGRILYQDFANDFGMSLDAAAEWCGEPDGAAASAAWYWGWSYHGQLNTLANQWQLTEITRRINGGLTNLAARVTACNAALRVFGNNVPPLPVHPAPAPAAHPAAPPAPVETVTADDLNAAQLAKHRT